MKYLFLLLSICFLYTNVHAQWSNTTNYFADSLHMPVCTEVQTQQHPLTIRSYPDGGYIVFWEDNRNTAATKQDIYAQKYDKNGKRLWKVNGVPVVKGANSQHFYSSTNADYRNYSYAITDSAGGFYVGYIDDSTTNYTWQRICVQHVLSNGTAVFANAGFIVAESKGNNYTYGTQQLIADGNDGFYIGFLRNTGGTQDLFVYCYKDVNNKMKFYGGGQMDINAYEEQIGSCSNYDIAYRDAFVNDYKIYPDLQNGCNTIMTLSQNAGGNDRFFTGFNRLIRVKKNTNIKTRDTSITYKKDDVLTFYKVRFHTYIFQCGDEIGTGYILESNGYLQTSDLTFQIEYSKGVTVPTSGNINADIFTFVERKYINNATTNWFTHAFYRSSEIYDSVPYEFTVSPYQPETYFGPSKPGLDKINYDNDTILYNGSVYDYDYSLTTGGNKVYAAGRLLNVTFSNYDILLQQLQVVKINADSFAVQFTTASHNGVVIGKEVSTGFGGGDISYNNPQVVADDNGNAIFYIREYRSYTRVSPIINGTQLAWGAMGRSTGSSAYNNSYYYPDNPFVSLDPSNGTGIVCWQDTRNYNGSTADNIFMRHLDSLNKSNYKPVYKTVKLLAGSGGQALPVAFTGSSKQFSLIEYLNYNSGSFNDASPIVEILDKYNLGAVSVNVFENNTTIRSYNGKFYLDRNYTIKPEINAKPSNKITLHLFFTTAEFNALKAADASVHHPSDLAVIQQPYTANNAPATYSPVTGETKINVQLWEAVSGGYYIEIEVKKFMDYTNYFIFPASAVLPLQHDNNLFSKTTNVNNSNKIFIEKTYPNPITKNLVYIQTGNESVKEMVVEIFSADGKLCYSKLLNYQSQTILLDQLANGIYTVRITSGKLTFKSSLIKTNGENKN